MAGSLATSEGLWSFDELLKRSESGYSTPPTQDDGSVRTAADCMRGVLVIR